MTPRSIGSGCDGLAAPGAERTASVGPTGVVGIRAPSPLPKPRFCCAINALPAHNPQRPAVYVDRASILPALSRACSTSVCALWINRGPAAWLALVQGLARSAEAGRSSRRCRAGCAPTWLSVVARELFQRGRDPGLVSSSKSVVLAGF